MCGVVVVVVECGVRTTLVTLSLAVDDTDYGASNSASASVVFAAAAAAD